MGYLKDAKRGVFWIGGYRGLTRVFSIIRTAIIARLLTPSQFGVYGIAALILTLLEIITETGINTVLVQKKGDVHEFIDTAWIVSITRGLIIFLLILLSAPVLATFFHIEEAKNLLYLTAFVPLVRGFINPSEVNFQRELRFQSEFYFRTILFLIDSLVSIALTVVTHSPYALIWGLLCGAIGELVISHIFITPHPRIVFNLSKLRYVVARGKWLTLTGFMDYLYQNGDNIVVGRLLGTSPLGIYQASYQYATSPVTEVSNILSRVMFPVYIKINDDRKRLFSAYLKTLTSIAAVVVPFSIVFILFPKQIVLLLLGSNWTEAIPILQVLALVAVVRSLVLSTYILFLSVEKQEYVTIVSVSGALSMLIIIPFSISMFGLIGACYASLLGSLISAVPAYLLIRKIRNKQ